MSHLAEVYAKDLGVRIGEPIFVPHFCPIMEDYYITIHNDDKVQSKCYDYWEEVINIVKSIVPEIKFLQIGQGKEPKIKNADEFVLTNSIKQSAYVIQKSQLHVGIDSLPVHVASYLDKPLVALYAHTYASTCCPLWGSKEKQIIIESHRDGKKPSYSLQESPKTVNFIKPEEIANAILSLLEKEQSKRETIHLGEKYKVEYINVIPDNKYSLVNKNLIIRLDLLHNEENILHLMNQNKFGVFTKEPVSDQILSNKNLHSISYFSDEFDEKFVSKAKSRGVKIELHCTKEENLKEQRVKFFDYQVFHYDKQKRIDEAKESLELKDEEFTIKSYSLYLKNGEAFASLYEANQKENFDDIYIDLNHLMIYKESNE